MRVLAATFSDREAAREVLNELRRRYDLDPEDAAVAPLGMNGIGPSPKTLLAGRFWEDRVLEIREFIEQHGGEVVADVDKRWTDPWLASAAMAVQDERTN